MKYDLIVLGTGGVGSSALFHAAEAGLRVLGLDRFPPGHDRGSSHGETRLIRQSYFEDPRYVPLLRTSYRLWDELADRTGLDLFHRTGIVYYGPPGGDLIRGVTESSGTHGIPLDYLSLEEARSRFPGFTAGEGDTAIFEPDAGYLLVEKCIISYIDEAVRLGAEHKSGETILQWSPSGEGFEVLTNQGRYFCSKLIITAGCWTNGLLGDLGIPLRVLRKPLYWFDAPPEIYSESRGCPGFMFEGAEDCYYGFPVSSPHGLKIGRHSGGREIGNPLEDNREQDPEDLGLISSFLRKHLPGVLERILRHEVCFYTMSPDEDYIIDQHPEHSNLAFAAGLSGHGFKCASALGETLVRMVSGREPEVGIGFLSARRFLGRY